MRTNSVMFCGFVLLALSTSITTPASAEIQFLLQSRFVEAGAEATDDIDYDSQSQHIPASGFAPFNEVAQAYGNMGGSGSAASGFQRTTLLPHAIHGFGSHSAWAEVFAEVGSSWASGASRCNIDFRLLEGSPITFQGYVEAYDNGGVAVILGDGTNTYYEYVFNDPNVNDHLDFNESGWLPAGDYHLTLETSGYSNGLPFQNQYAFGAFDVSLILGSATGVGGITHAPSTVTRAYPNPFQSATRIVPSSTARELNVYDLAGRLVRRWMTSEVIEWDGTDQAGRKLAPGVYFVRGVGNATEEPLKLVRVR